MDNSQDIKKEEGNDDKKEEKPEEEETEEEKQRRFEKANKTAVLDSQIGEDGKKIQSVE